MTNEITVRLDCSINEICEILERKQFKIVDKFNLDDTYFILKDINIGGVSPREILKNSIIVRDIKQFIPNNFCEFYYIPQIIYKNKVISENGDILSQDKIECEIKEIKVGINLIKAIGYKELINIKEADIVYKKSNLKIYVKDVKNGDNLIEVELVENNKELNTIEKLKQKINELELPIDKTNYFVKKAEIELRKIL